MVKLIKISIVLLIIACGTTAKAQPAVVSKQNYNSLILVYDINISSTKKKAGIEETYNGGVKTIMLQNNKARVRLVSLMRIQSHFFQMHDSGLVYMVISKESGKEKTKNQLSASDWKIHNTKYESLSCEFSDESISVAGYNCKKAIITAPSENKKVIAYYCPQLKPLHTFIEPLFAGIPGIVLQYTVEDKTGSLSFTASKVSFEPVAENLVAEK